MVKIRLRRMGARGRPSYRIVVADSRSPRDGAFIEVIGHYNPLTDPETFDIDKEKVSKWLGCGAKPTQTVERLLVKSGLQEKKERVLSTKAKKKAQPESPAEVKPQAAE